MTQSFVAIHCGHDGAQKGFSASCIRYAVCNSNSTEVHLVSINADACMLIYGTETCGACIVLLASVIVVASLVIKDQLGLNESFLRVK